MQVIQEIIKGSYKAIELQLNSHQQTTMKMIMKCRTGELGYHKVICESCKETTYKANTCRNRNCPCCQTIAKNRWIEREKLESLEIAHYHVVGTTPKILYQIMYQNQEIMYEIIMSSLAEAIQKIKKKEGKEVGIIEMLHTWNQQLGYHPHVHALVTAGGVEKRGKWERDKYEYMCSVKALSKVYRGKIIAKLKKIYDKLEFYKEAEKYKDKKEWDKLIKELRKKEFVTYVKEPYKNAETVIEYFGRYAYKVGITNSRIINYEEGKVRFKYKDRKDENKEKVLELEDKEFVRRLSMHILPKGFRKIRRYGIYANRDRRKRIKEINKKIMNSKIIQSFKKKINKKSEKLARCPKCGSEKIRYEYKLRYEEERLLRLIS